MADQELMLKVPIIHHKNIAVYITQSGSILYIELYPKYIQQSQNLKWVLHLSLVCI